MSERPPVSVIIPTHQRRDPLERALDALAAQTAPPGSFEVIVSVDGSDDGTWEMLESLEPGYPLNSVEAPSRGRAAARNRAIELARGDVLVVLDDDMRPAEAFIESHRRHHVPGSRLCVLGAVPVQLNGSSPHAARYVQAKFQAHLNELANPDHRYGPRDFYSGNMSVRTEVMREVGGFDEAFAPYGNEDVELSLRLRSAGVELRFDPDALAHQEYAKAFADLAVDTLAKGGTTVLMSRKHPASFPLLRLAAPGDGSRPWRALRALLLGLARRRPRSTSRIIAVAAALERAGLWRQPLFYRASLDYAFWAGVDRELLDSDRGDLASLAAELHRGPLDLLLHG